MTDEKANKSNTPKDLSVITAESEKNTLDNLPTTETREDKFIRNLYLFKTPYEAAIKSGYSENYASSGIYAKMKGKKFMEKVVQYAIENDIRSLPKIAYIENQILDHLVENPLETPKYVHTIRQKKRIAGVLGDDKPQPQITVNIKTLEAAQVNLRNMLDESLDLEKSGKTDK
jgi:hypothetical protein